MYTCPTFVDCLEIHIVVVYSVTSVDSGVAHCYREGEGGGERAWSNPSLFIDSPDRLDWLSTCMPTNGKCPQNANSTALTSDITLKKLQFKNPSISRIIIHNL